MKRRALFIIVPIFFLIVAALGQETIAPLPSFEVASIEPSNAFEVIFIDSVERPSEN